MKIKNILRYIWQYSWHRTKHTPYKTHTVQNTHPANTEQTN